MWIEHTKKMKKNIYKYEAIYGMCVVNWWLAEFKTGSTINIKWTNQMCK